MQLVVPPPEPPVPVLPLTTGSTLLMETSNAPTVVAVLPAATWICMSTGVPSVPVLVQVAVATIGGSDQLGHVTSAKQTVAASGRGERRILLEGRHGSRRWRRPLREADADDVAAAASR